MLAGTAVTAVQFGVAQATPSTVPYNPGDKRKVNWSDIDRNVIRRIDNMPTTVVPGPLGRMAKQTGQSNLLSGNRKRSVQRLLFNEDTETYRWQSVSDYYKALTGPGSSAVTSTLPLVAKQEGVTGAAGYVFFPVYCINLTSPGYGSQTVVDPVTGVQTYEPRVDFKPVYRLFRQDQTPAGTATINSIFQNYSWVPVTGVRNDPAGVSNNDYYSLEDTNLSGSVGLLNKSKGVHDWTSVDLLFQNPRQRPTKIHLYEVSFQNCLVGPRRVVRVGGDDPINFDDETFDADTVRDSDTFWDKFLAKKIFGPLSILKDRPLSGRRLKIWNHQVINCPPALSIDVDSQPYLFHKKIFYKGGRLMDFQSNAGIETSADGVTNYSNRYMPTSSDAEGQTKLGYDDTISKAYTRPCQEYSQDRWLMIVSENYDQVLAEAGALDSRFHPSFDLVLRQKYTWTSAIA